MDINLDTSDWRLWVMCVIILGCLAFWLAAVYIAAANPGRRNARPGMRGPAEGDAAEPSRPDPSTPRPAHDQDVSVPMPAQPAESPADNAQPTHRP